MHDLAQDFRFSVRQIRRTPGFFAIASLLIAIGIAATTLVFTLVDALLLRPLPVREPHNLVQLFEQQAKRPASPYFDYGFYRQLAHDSATLFGIAGQIETTRAVERNGVIERAHVVAVTENFFSDLGVMPRLGRMLGSRDTHIAVLSDTCWLRSFGRDPNMVGKVVRIQGTPYIIAGVAPEGFSGTTIDSSPDLWIPYANLPEFSRIHNPDLDRYVTEIVGRLRPGITEARAQQEIESRWNRYMQISARGLSSDYKGLTRGRLEVRSIEHGTSPLRGQSQTTLILLLAGTALLLLMVCANVGGLLLARATTRERETAVRVALGASQWRILRQCLADSLLLASTGGCAGVLIAYMSMPLLMRWMPPARGAGFDPSEIRTLILRPSLDLRVAAFALAACVLTALLCALAPAWRSACLEINMALKSTSSDRRHRVVQPALSVFQIAICTTLLVTAGLVIRSLANLRATDAGFDREHVVVFSIDPYLRGYDAKTTWSVEQRILNEVRKVPGVEGAAIAGQGLMRGIGLGNSVVFPGQSAGGVINCSVNSVTPEYFSVMGMHVLAGQNLRPSDVAEEGKLAKVMVNSAFVQKFLNGQEPIGATFGTGKRFVKAEYEIIGVVNDTKYRSLRETPPPIYYYSGFGPKADVDTFVLHVRSYQNAHSVEAPVRKLLQSIDAGLSPYQIATLTEEVSRSLWQEQLLVALTTCFGGFALLLSAIGLYGVLSYFVARRQRELGLRMALGAGSADVLWLVARRVIPILGVGLVAGSGIAWLTSLWMRSLLYGVASFDVLTSAVTLAMLVSIGITAAAMPARRAIRVEPWKTLRQE